MSGLTTMSPASRALGSISTNPGLGDNLSQQVQDETDETRRKRMQAVKGASYSAAGQMLAANFAMSVPGATV